MVSCILSQTYKESLFNSFVIFLYNMKPDIIISIIISVNYRPFMIDPFTLNKLMVIFPSI